MIVTFPVQSNRYLDLSKSYYPIPNTKYNVRFCPSVI